MEKATEFCCMTVDVSYGATQIQQNSLAGVFKPGALATGRHMPGFLKVFLCGRLYVCLCVSAPEAINN